MHSAKMGQDDIHSPHPISVDEEVAQKSQYCDADEALKFLQYNETGDELSIVDEKALVKKIDWMIVPLMFACYFLQYMDKSLRTSIHVHPRLSLAYIEM
jgi:hypothetical protein